VLLFPYDYYCLDAFYELFNLLCLWFVCRLSAPRRLESLASMVSYQCLFVHHFAVLYSRECIQILSFCWYCSYIGTRYGASLRKQIKKMEVSQHSKYFCEFCGKVIQIMIEWLFTLLVKILNWLVVVFLLRPCWVSHTCSSQALLVDMFSYLVEYSYVSDESCCWCINCYWNYTHSGAMRHLGCLLELIVRNYI
jgi:hypothetical protein